MFFKIFDCICWCDIFRRLNVFRCFIWVCVWFCLSVLCRCCLIVWLFWFFFMLMKLIMMRLVRLCSWYWCVIFVVVLMFVLMVVFFMLCFLVDLLEFMLIEMSVFVGLIMRYLLDGSGIFGDKVVFNWFFILNFWNIDFCFLCCFMFLVWFGIKSCMKFFVFL